ncbi:MAG TPA: DUF3048 C-terminal domain-containing protein [Anaerolineaceae bacterium]
MFQKSLYILVGISLLLASCTAAAPQNTPQPGAVTLPPTAVPTALTLDPTAAATQIPATQAPQLSATAPEPSATAAAPDATAAPAQAASPGAAIASGPEEYPAGINPLTGLPVENPANLQAPPALVSITNFPITARPQAGLSYSPVVHEVYVGEGTTRFLAMFYGDFPKEAVSENDAPSSGSPNVVSDSAEIGPVRSGRVSYEHLRALYNGFLVMASADPSVGATLNQTTNVYADNPGDVNSAMVNVSQLEKLAQSQQQRSGAVDLQGLAFDPAAPADGQPASSLWVPYALLDQVIWRYNAADGSYHRFQDQADGKTFVEATDRLNGEPLTYENVVVLFATHHAYAETIIDIDLLGIGKAPALLFRDGKVYNIYWTTANGEYERTTGKLRPIRFIDAQGNPIPLKPGQTWVHIMPNYSPVYETVDSEVYYDKTESKATPGSGNWAVRFYPPNLEPRPTKTPKK